MTGESEWYYAKGQEHQGPITREELRQLMATGTVARTDLVWKEGMAQWTPAQQVPGLLDAAVAPPPLPPGGPLRSAFPPMTPMPLGTGAPLPPGAPLQYYVPPAQQPDMPTDAGVRLLIPVGRSGWAIAAGYLGLFSVLACPAPLALIISLIAIRDIKTHPNRHGMGRAVFGLVMGIIGSIFLIVGIVAVSLKNH